MIVMLPVEDRSPVLRSIWNKLPKTQKAYFVVRLIEALDAEAKKDIEEATSFALASPEPTPESAMDFILA